MSDQAIGETPSSGTASLAPSVPTAASGPGVSDRAKDLLGQTAPWRRGIGWPIVGIEGLVAIVVGIYVIADPEGARDVVRQILGAALLINSVLRILHGFRENARGLPGTPFRLVSGGMGLAIGLIVVLEPISDFVTPDAARVILALGFLAFGLIGLMASVATRETGGLRRGPLITGVLYTVFAVLLFYNARRESLNMEIFGVVFIIFGVLLLGFAFLLRRAAKSGDAAASSAAV